jgi:hypothetical protein
MDSTSEGVFGSERIRGTGTPEGLCLAQGLRAGGRNAMTGMEPMSPPVLVRTHWPPDLVLGGFPERSNIFMDSVPRDRPRKTRTFAR